MGLLGHAAERYHGDMGDDAGSQQVTMLLLADNLPDAFGHGAQGRIIQMCIPRRCLWTAMT